MGALGGRLDVDGEVAAPSQHFLLLPRCLHRLLQSLYFFLAIFLRCSLLRLKSVIGLSVLTVQVVQERLVVAEAPAAEYAEVGGDLADSHVPSELLLPLITVPAWAHYKERR